MSIADDYIDSGWQNADQAEAPYLVGNDTAEWQKMQPYVTQAQGEQAPWWQSVIKYGITKAVDNTFPSQSTGVRGNTNPGTFAGQNGRTYSNANSVGGLVSSVSNMSPMTLLLIAGGIYLLSR